MPVRSASLPGRLTSAVSLCFTLLLAGCGGAPAPHAARVAAPAAESAANPLRAALAAQASLSDAWLARADVVGTGAAVGADGRPEVVVLLASARAQLLPAAVGGVRVVTIVTGPLRPWALTGTYRPLAIGVSAGNANECLPGTLGCVLERGSHTYLLSANHVFARQNRAAIGEVAVQPSLPDLSAGCAPAPPSAAVATLADFQPVVYDGKTPNTMDAAIAEVTLPASQVSGATPPGYYGFPGAGTAAAVAGLRVQKLGRTTGLTHATVKAVNVKTKITFPSGPALFVDQVLTTQGFGDFGDSGALVVTDDAARRPVGMVIGGGTNGAAIVTPIAPVLARFGATIRTR